MMTPQAFNNYLNEQYAAIQVATGNPLKKNKKIQNTAEALQTEQNYARLVTQQELDKVLGAAGKVIG